MFDHQLIAETIPSQSRMPQAAALNDSESVRRLVEHAMGYQQFRVVLPGTVTWIGRGDHGGPAKTMCVGTLAEAVMSFVPQDRARVVDALGKAIAQKNGFRFTARVSRVGQCPRVIEAIGDVIVENDEVTGLFGLTRDISDEVEQEALAISRARLIARMIEGMPVPVVVLDRSLRVVACSEDWVQVYGLGCREAALGRPLGKIIDARGPLSDGIIEALNGRVARVSLEFYAAEDRRQVRRTCTTMPWESGANDRAGVLIIYGTGEPAFASLDIAARVQGANMTSSLLAMLELM